VRTHMHCSITKRPISGTGELETVLVEAATGRFDLLAVNNSKMTIRDLVTGSHSVKSAIMVVGKCPNSSLHVMGRKLSSSRK